MGTTKEDTMDLVNLLWIFVFMYAAIQLAVLFLASGRARLLLALPLIFMAPIYVFTAIAFIQESNLWPLWLLFSSPAALLYILILLASFGLAGQPRT
jgi:hypothetical protein